MLSKWDLKFPPTTGWPYLGLMPLSHIVPIQRQVDLGLTLEMECASAELSFSSRVHYRFHLIPGPHGEAIYLPGLIH